MSAVDKWGRRWSLLKTSRRRIVDEVIGRIAGSACGSSWRRPQAYECDTEFWTLKRIIVVIEREFDVSVCQTTVWRYLKKIG
jgi:transposase